MLCPRCNSENDLGERFCKFCGAPLTDAVAPVQEERKIRKQKPVKQPKAPREPRTQRTPRRTYSLNEGAYRRDHVGPIISIFKSILILLVLVVLIYFIVTAVMVKRAQSTDTYNIGGDKIASVNYVLGDRDLYKVKYGWEDGTLTKTYLIRNMDNMSEDLIKYIGYLIENHSFTLDGIFDPSQSESSIRLIANSASAYANVDVVEISWNDEECGIKMYRTLESNVKKTDK